MIMTDNIGATSIQITVHLMYLFAHKMLSFCRSHCKNGAYWSDFINMLEYIANS